MLVYLLLLPALMDRVRTAWILLAASFFHGLAFDFPELLFSTPTRLIY